MRGKLLLILALAAVVALYFALDLNRTLSFERLKESRQELAGLVAARPFLYAGLYFGLYVLVAGLSLPGATPLSIVGGAVFGLLPAVLLVSFASSIGATIACAASRYLLRETARRRFAAIFEKIESGMAREGAFYLFTLRLIPVFPFFVINIVMGLTSISLTRFYLVSQAGMLPATLVFVNAGSEIAKISQPADVLSPQLLASFALLGIFPLAAKRVVERVKKWRNQGGNPLL